MILPMFAGLDRLPDSLLEASSDLGARRRGPSARGAARLLFPAVVAGSIFTFSLTLGDFVAVNIVGGKTQMIGNVIYANVGAANNLPFAAALAAIPVVIMLVYLLAPGGPGPWRASDAPVPGPDGVALPRSPWSSWPSSTPLAGGGDQLLQPARVRLAPDGFTVEWWGRAGNSGRGGALDLGQAAAGPPWPP